MGQYGALPSSMSPSPLPHHYLLRTDQSLACGLPPRSNFSLEQLAVGRPFRTADHQCLPYRAATQLSAHAHLVADGLATQRIDRRQRRLECHDIRRPAAHSISSRSSSTSMQCRIHLTCVSTSTTSPTFLRIRWRRPQRGEPIWTRNLI